MLTSPLVSVIIPAHNAGSYIRQTILSVLSQTYDHLEIIVVDDGSHDQTVEIVRSLAAQDPRIRLLTQANRGVAAARNAAIRASSGEFIAPLDADDVWFPEKLEKQLQRFSEFDSDVGLVYTWWVALDDDESTLWASSEWDVEGAVLGPLLVTNFVGNASVPLIRRECIERLGDYDHRLRLHGGQGCEDWDLSLRIAEYYEIRVVPEYLVGYRRLADGLSSDHTSMGRSFELVVEALRRRHPEIPPSLFRWSRKNFFLWLASRNYAVGDYPAALRWLAKSVYADPLAIISGRVIALLLKSAVQMAAYPIISLLWTNHQDWMAFRNRYLNPRQRRTVVTDTKQNANTRQKAFPHNWKSWKPYDVICMRRWRRITDVRGGGEKWLMSKKKLADGVATQQII